MIKSETNATETPSFACLDKSVRQGGGRGRLANHEMWHICAFCGAEFDRRLYIDQCPYCRTLIYEKP